VDLRAATRQTCAHEALEKFEKLELFDPQAEKFTLFSPPVARIFYSLLHEGFFKFIIQSCSCSCTLVAELGGGRRDNVTGV
jgi:hypothetical protein